MKIIESDYKWAGKLSNRKTTKHIIIHHSAGSSSAADVHRIHLNNGWIGIGYHFYVRSDGSIYRGRPLNTVGAHTSGYNSVSVGVCFEGNFETNSSMSSAQCKAGKELIDFLRKQYPGASVRKHKDFNATACPGKNFPFKEITAPPETNSAVAELESVNDIVWELSHRGIITDTAFWLDKLASDKNAYWLARKTANMTVNK